MGRSKIFGQGVQICKSIWSIYPTFPEIPLENEIIWTQSGIWAMSPNPL